MSTIPKNEFYEPGQGMDEIEVEGLGTFEGVKMVHEPMPSYREWRLAANIASRLLTGRGVNTSVNGSLKESVIAAKEIIRLSKMR